MARPRRSREADDGAADRVTALAVGCIDTSAEAFAAFYVEHVEAVQRFVARRVADRDVAADLTADIFVAAIESAHTYRSGRGTPGAWLFGVARIVVSGHRRKVARTTDATRRFRG